MTNADIPDWSLSVISHGHGAAIRRLLAELKERLNPARHEVLLTLNRADDDGGWEGCWPGPFQLIRNLRSQGFGANHNAALRRARGRWVAAIDPDLRFEGDPFPRLARALADPHVGIVATRVWDEYRAIADHARLLPTPMRVLRRTLLRDEPTYNECLGCEFEIDWVAGLFMAMSRDTFHRLGGFDTRYFMYCEDVDLCLRAWNLGMSVRVVPAARVIHPARRQTLRRPQHFLWHMRSLIRLWASSAYKSYQWRIEHEH